MSKAAAASDVVLFLGDAAAVDPLVHALVDERMGAASQALDFEVFRFGETPVSEMEGALRQVGMFSPQRCIWLRGFVEVRRKAAGSSASTRDDAEEGDADGETREPSEDEDADGIAEVLALLEAGIPSGTVFVVSAPTLDARGRLSKWFTRYADVRDRRIAVERGGKLREEKLRQAVDAHLEQLGVTRVGAGAVDEIVRRSGNVLGETLQEIDRLVLAQSDPARLGAAEVRSGMRDLALGWVFDLTDALEKRDLGGAEKLVARLLADGEPPLRLCGLLASHVATLAAARPVVDTLPQGWMRMRGTDFLAGPGAALPESLRGWPGYFRLRAASNFTSVELRLLHGGVKQLDLALKSSPSPPLLLFSRLLQRACIPGARA